MAENDALIYHIKPALRSPYILCGLSGWLNGGDVSVGGINYFIRQFKGIRFAELPSSRYHVYQVPGAETIRPIFKMQDGLIIETHFPKNEFFYALNPSGEHDLIFFLGTEPSLAWEEYANSVITLANDFKATRLFAFGGILDRSPYTREPRVSCTCTSSKVKSELVKYNVTFSSREGTATFNQMLLYACNKKGLDGVALTVRAPYYPEVNVAIDYSPKSIKAVLVRLNHMMHLNMNFKELDESVRELEGKLDFVKKQNPQFIAYMEELEKNYQEMPFQEPLDMSASEGVRLAEELLREHHDKRQGQS